MKTSISNNSVIEFIVGQMKALISLDDQVGTEEWRTYCHILNNTLSEEERTPIYEGLKKYRTELWGKKSNS